MKRLALLLLLLISLSPLSSQTAYPVRTQAMVLPPVPQGLSGFAGPSGRLRLHVHVDDVSLEPRPAYLRLYLSGAGVRLRTRPDYRLPYLLEGGAHEVLTGEDLAPLLDPRNLVFEGYSQQAYRRSGTLPEGVYRIRVEVWDAAHDVNLSGASPAVAAIYLVREPRPAFPLDGAEVDASAMAPLRFSWVGSVPNDPSADPAYRFSLYEIRPEGRNPYAAAGSAPPVFEEETRLPQFVYGPGLPPLEEGLEYAWRVRAVDLEGKARYRNDGLSEVRSFRYGLSCPVPETELDEAGTSWAGLKLRGAPGRPCRVLYRKLGKEKWEAAFAAGPSVRLEGLEEGSPYEARAVALCGAEESEEGPSLRFRTAADTRYNCGGPAQRFDVSNREPLRELRRHETFKAADFTVEVTEAEGSGGRFSGEGLIGVPYFGPGKFMVTFEDIYVNSDRRMVEGHVSFARDEDFPVLEDFPEPPGPDDETAARALFDGHLETGSEGIREILVDGNTVTVVGNDGKRRSLAVEPGGTVAVTAEGGETLHVADTGTGAVYAAPLPSSGKASPGTALPPSAAGTEKGGGGGRGKGVRFLPSPLQRYGHDAPRGGRRKLRRHYETDGHGNPAAWKSLAAGGAEYVDADTGGADSLRYIRSSGMPAPSARIGKGRHRLLLPGLPGGGEEMLTAASVHAARCDGCEGREGKETLFEEGWLGLASYVPMTKRVVLVPLNGGRCPDRPRGVERGLNKIYASALVSWHVMVDEPFEYGLGPSAFDLDRKSPVSMYTREMNLMLEAYLEERVPLPDPGTSFLFFVDDPGQRRKGYMPLRSEYGFIFNFRVDLETVAHELAHGVFGLRHTFSSMASCPQPEGTTQNLMDYAGGTELTKVQWDMIHHPRKVFFKNLQRKEEGAYVEGLYFVDYAKENITLHTDMLDGEGNLAYVTPSGRPFVLPRTCLPSFSGKLDGGDPHKKLGIPKGVLLGFEDDLGKRWLASFTDPSSGAVRFNGYKNGKKIKETNIGGKGEHKIVAGIENDYCRLEIMSDNYRYQTTATDRHTGAGHILRGRELALSADRSLRKSIRINKGCTPENWLELPDIDFDTFNNNVVARYNHYGRGGTLCKLSSGHYYYINVDGEGNDRYMIWNGAGNEWQVYEPQDPQCTSCELRELLTYRALFELLGESGHGALDAIGMVPLLGEPADLLNAGWYLLEGDMCGASVSALGILPAIGDVVGKSLKYLKKVGDAVEVAELSGDRLKAFDRLGKRISELPQGADVARGFENLAGALGGTEESLRHLGAITDGAGAESVVGFLEKINNLEAGKRAQCLADLAAALKNADADLAKRADKMVEAWKMAAKHADLRTNTTVLSKLNDIAGRGRGIDRAKLKSALDDDLGDVLNKATGDDLTSILNRLDAEHVTGTHLDEITNRLKTYPELKTDLLDNPKWFETFDDVLQNPGRYWEILSEGNIASGSAMAKWGQGKWWKNLRDLADDFDKNIVTNSMIDEFGLDNVVGQVTLQVTSKSGVKKTIRIDNLALDDISSKYVLGDAKFTTKTKDWDADWLSSCTDNQKDVFKWFENSDVQDIVVKATDSKKIDALDNISLKPNSKIDFNSTNLRLYGSDANQQAVKTIVNIK